jgi:hypothetical protein
MDNLDKLRILLPHWIEHNDEHADEFTGWADKALAEGQGHLSACIQAAAQKLREANSALRDGLDDLGEAHEPGHPPHSPHDHHHPH